VASVVASELALDRGAVGGRWGCSRLARPCRFVACYRKEATGGRNMATIGGNLLQRT